MSIWLSAWIRPTETINKIVKHPNKGLLILSWIYGLTSLFQIAQIYALSDKIRPSILLLSIFLLAPIWGYILFTVAAFLIYITGKLIKGKGDFVECRSALAWSALPYIFSLGAWLLLFLNFGEEIFSYFPGKEKMTAPEVSFLTIMLLMQITAFIWSLVLLIYNLAAVQKFSPAQSIINALFALGLLIILMFILYLFAVFIWAYAL